MTTAECRQCGRSLATEGKHTDYWRERALKAEAHASELRRAAVSPRGRGRAAVVEAAEALRAGRPHLEFNKTTVPSEKLAALFTALAALETEEKA